METKKENPIKPSGSLLIKIFAGYTILALLVIGSSLLYGMKKRFLRKQKRKRTQCLHNGN